MKKRKERSSAKEKKKKKIREILWSNPIADILDDEGKKFFGFKVVKKLRKK